MKKCGLLAILFGMAAMSFGLFSSCDIGIGLGAAVDTEPPTLEITNPPTSAIIRDTFVITGTWKDDGSIKDVIVDLRNTSDSSNEIYSFTGKLEEDNKWCATIDPFNPKKIPDGKYEATITLTDNGGHHTISTRAFVIDNTAPVVILSRPASDSSETDANKIESYGQYLTLEGQASDDNNIEKIIVEFYNVDDPDTVIAEKVIDSIPPTISLDVAKFLDNDVYTEIYGNDKSTGEKSYTCTITAYDGAKRYPAAGNEKADDEYGNGEASFILWADWEKFQNNYQKATGLTSKIKVPDLYALKTGKTIASAERSAETNNIIEEFFNKKVTRASFKLNPLNNPSYSISGLDLGVVSEVENERSLTIQLAKGLDGLSLDTENMKVYLIPLDTDAEGKEVRGSKLYPQQSEFQQKGDGQFLTTIQKDNVKDAAGNVTNLVYGTKYVIGVEGTDSEGNAIVPSFDGKEFLIRFKAKNVAPGLTIESPSGSNTYIKKGEKLLIKGTTSVPDGYPTVSISCKVGEETTAKTVYNHKVTEADKARTEGGLIYYNFQFEVPITGAQDTFFFSQEKSNQYVFDITSDLDNMPNTRTKTIIYDVDGPTISIDSMLPTAEKYNSLGEKQAGDFLNGDVTMKVAILDEYDSVNTEIKDPNNDKRPYFIIVDENGTEIPFRVGTETATSIKHYITTPAKQSFVIKTEDIAKGTEVKNIKVKVFAEDRAGNKGVDIDDPTKAYYERSYTVDQTTDIPWIIPKNAATSNLTYTKEQAKNLDNTTVNVYFANQTVSYRMIDDDGLVQAKYKIVKAAVADEAENEVKKEDTINTNGASEYQIEVTMPDDPGTYHVFLETTDKNTEETTGSAAKSTSRDFYIRVTAAAPTIEEIQLQETKVRGDIVITPIVKIKSDQVPFKLERTVKKVVANGEVVDCPGLSKTYTYDGSNGTTVYQNLNTESPAVSDSITINTDAGKFDSSANYIINYKVLDKNNKDGKGTKEITVDLNAPNITAVNLSGNAYDANSWYNSKTLALEVAAADISGETGIDAVEYSTNSTVWTALSYDSSTEKYAGSAVFPSEGSSNSLYIRAKDKAGNIKYFDGTTANGVLSSSPVSINVKIDTSAPVLHVNSYKIGDLAAVTDIASSKIYVKDGITLTVSGNYKDEDSGINSSSLAFEFGTMPVPVVTKDDTTTPPSWTATYTIDKTKSLGELSVKTQNNAGIETQVSSFEVVLDDEYPILKTISLSTDSTNTAVYKKSDTEYYVNNTKPFGTASATPKFTLAGISTDNKGVAKVTLYEGSGTSRVKVAEKTDSDFSFTGLDWKNRTDDLTLTLTATDIAGNENPETLPAGRDAKYKAVTLTIHFDTTGPVGTHENDLRHKDIYFRIGDQDRDDGVQKDSDNKVVNNPATGKPSATDGQPAWNSELDENVGGKYKKDTFGNKTTITLRGKIDDSGSGVDLIYYKIYHDLSQFTSKSDADLIADVVAEKSYFAPFATAETKRVYYNSGSAHNDSVESTYRTTISKFVEGQNYLVLVAKDKVGNYSIDTPYDENDVVIKYYSMNVDTTAPGINKTVDKEILYSDGGEFTVEVMVSDPETKSLTGVDIENSASGIDSVILSTTKGKVPASLKSGTTDIYAANIASILENEKSLTVNAVATDKAGSSSSMIVANVMVDTRAPDVTIITPAANAKTNNVISLSGSVSDGTGSGVKESEGITLYYTKTDSVGTVKPTASTISNWTAYTTKPDLSNQTWSGSFSVPEDVAPFNANTTLYLSAGAVDNAGIDTSRAGNPGYSAPVTIVVDRKAPESSSLTIDETAGSDLGENTTKWFNNTTVSLSGTFTDTNGSGVASVKYAVKKAGASDYAADQTIASDGAYTANVKGLAAGTNTIKVWAVDTAGNASTPTEYTVKVDGVAPVITSDYTGVIYATSASCPVNLTVTDAGASELKDVKVTIGSYTATCTNSGSNYTTDLQGHIPEGTTSVTATATDNAGNVTSQVIANIMLDTTGPELVINTPAANAKTSNVISLSGSVSDGTGSGVKTSEKVTLYYTTKVPTELTETKTTYDTNETSIQPDTTKGWVAYEPKMDITGQTWNGSFTVPDDVAQPGNNTALYISAGAVDKSGSGNPGYSAPVTIVVDRKAPSIASSGVFVDTTNVSTLGSGTTNWFNNTTVNLNGTFTDDESGVASVKYQLKKGTGSYGTEQTVASDGAFSTNIKDLAAGTNTIKVWAVDKAGNASTAAEYTVKVDGVAPVITSDYTGVIYATSASCPVNLTVTDAGASELKDVKVTIGSYTATCTNSGSNYTTDLQGHIPEGTTSVTATATDNAGNVTSQVIANIMLDTTGPELVINTPAANAKTSNVISLSGSVSDGTGSGVKTSEKVTLYYTTKVPTELTETKTTYDTNETSIQPDTTKGWVAYEPKMDITGQTWNGSFTVPDDVAQPGNNTALYISAGAVDKSGTNGNPGYSVPVAVVVDRKAPVKSLFKVGTTEEASVNTTWFNNETLNINGEFTDDGGSGVSAILYTLDGGTEQEIPTTDGTFNTNIAGFTTGSHTLTVRAKDKVNNYSGSTPYTIQVDKSQPEISAGATDDFSKITMTNGTGTQTFYFDISDTGSGIATGSTAVTVKAGPRIITHGSNNNSISVVAVSETGTTKTYRATITIGATDLNALTDNNSVNVIVTDKSGNQSESQTIGYLKVDKDAPAPSFTSHRANATVNKTITLGGLITDASNSKITAVTLTANDLEFTQINNWTANTVYEANDIVYKNNTYYKCKTAHTSDESFDATNWDSDSGHGYIIYADGQWTATLDTTQLYNGTSEQTLNLSIKATDAAGNETATAVTQSLTIDQNDDRPVVKFTNLVKEGTGANAKYILKYGNAAALEGTITDDDATSDKVVKTFYASSSAITSISGWENVKDDEGKETNTWKHTTDDGDEYVDFNAATGDYTFTPASAADGAKTVYFYIVDNNDNVFYTTQTTQLTRPYKQYKTDAKEDNATAITYNSDSNAPLINSVQLQAYTAPTANMVTQGEGDEATQVDTTKNGVLTSLGTNCVVGGTSKNYVDLKVSAKDANGVKGIVIKVQQGTTTSYYRSNNTVSETGVTTYANTGTVTATTNDTSNHEYTTSRINITNYVNGQVTVTVKVYDNSGLYNNQESVFVIDRIAPKILIDNNVAEDQVVYGINKITIGGTANATDVDKIYYTVTDSDTESSSVTNWIEVEGQKISASIIFGGTQADEAYGLPSYTLRKWMQTVYSYDDTYMTEHDENKDLSIHFKAVDTCGNAGYSKRNVSVVPNGDKPIITLSYPIDKAANEHPSLAGTIRVYGNAEVVTGSVSAVYVQIDTAYNGTTFNANWKSGFDTCIAGKNTSYEIETFGSGTTAMQGIKATGTLNWNLPINSNKEFNPASGSGSDIRNVAIRIYGVGKSGKVSEPVIQEFTIDPNAPHIGGTGADAGVMQLKLVQFNSSNPLTAAMTYSQAQSAIANQMPYVLGQTVWVKGQWYIAASVYDDSGIATITLDENQGGQKITLVTGSVKQDDKQINTTQTEKTIFVKANDCKAAINNVENKKNFDIYIPLPTSTGSGNLEFTIEAFEASDDGNNSTEKVKVNWDNTPPKLGTVGHDNYNANAYNVQQDNGFYRLFGYATDAEGNNLVSDMKAVAFYFVRRGTAATNPVTKVYDPMWKNKSVAIQTGTTNTEGISYEYGMFWNKKAVGRSSTDLSVLTLTTKDDNIHAGGFVLMGGTIYTIRSVSADGTTITLKTDAPAGITEAKFAYAMVIDNFNMTESVDTRQKETDSSKYGYGYYKADATADDGDLMQEKWASGKWEAWINSANIPDGPIEIHYVAIDNAQNFSTGIVGNLSLTEYQKKTTLDVTANGTPGTAANNLISGFDYIYDANKKAYVSNNAPRIAGIIVGTDYNGNGTIEASEKQPKYVELGTRVFSSVPNTSTITKVLQQFNASSDGTASGLPFMRVVDDTSVEIEIIGGNNEMYYRYHITENCDDTATFTNGTYGTGKTSWQITRTPGEGYKTDDDGHQGYYTTTTLPAINFTTDQLKDAIRVDEDDEGENGTRWWTIQVWDSTEETTHFVNSQYAELKLPLNVEVLDTTPPNTVINPLYWNSSSDNSVYKNANNKLFGHIELKSDLETGIGKLGTVYGTDDDKISGIVTFSGYAYDNKRLAKLKWGIKDKLTGNILQAWPQQYVDYSVYTAGSGWSAPGSETLALPYYYFKVYDDASHGAYLDERGHKVYWELTIDTSRVQEPGKAVDPALGVGENLYVYVWAEDSSYVDDTTTPNNKTNLNPTVKTNGTDAENISPNYKVDVLPYIKGVKTRLATKNKKNPEVYSRTAQGHYPIASDETEVILQGFNLAAGNADVNISSTIESSTTGAYAYTIPDTTITTINNMNNNNAHGAFDIANASYSEETKVLNMYNRTPSTVTNLTLNDDVYFDIWEFKKAAVVKSGKINEPVMKINPYNQMIGFAFANGADTLSLPNRTNSYEAWQRNFADYAGINFVYDSNGYVHSISTGLDTEPNAGLAGYMQYIFSRWGGNENKKYNWNSKYTAALESVGIPSGVYVNGKALTSNLIDVDRFGKPALAVSNGNRVYVAYYDGDNNQIRFRYGTVGNNKSGRVSTNGQFSDDKAARGTIGTDNRAGADNAQNNDRTPENDRPNGSNYNEHKMFEAHTEYYSLLAGKTQGATQTDTGNGTSEFVALDVIAGDSAANDKVVIVWYDGSDLMYTYREGTKDDTDCSSGGVTGKWSKPEVIFEGAGQYCTIKVDKNNGIHIAAYNRSGADLYYCYMSGYDKYASRKTALVDSYSQVGKYISLDTALVLREGSTTEYNVVPYITYYGDGFNGLPKLAYLPGGINKDAVDVPNGADDDTDLFTGEWEVSLIPTSSEVNEDNMNVALWKTNAGVLTNSTKPATGYTEPTITAAGTNSATWYGNGTSKFVLGYGITANATGFIEIGQMKNPEQ